MAAPFSRTLRSLDADGARRRTAALLAVALLLGAWLAWFLFGSVAVYEVSDRARLEVEAAAHPLAAPVGGRIAMTHLELGRNVRAGELLVELEAETERLTLEEARVRCEGVRSRIAAVRLEIEAERAAAVVHEKSGLAALEEARARVAEAEAKAQFAEFQQKSMAALRDQDVISEEQFRKAKAEAEACRAAASARELEANHTEEQHRYEQLDRKADIAELEAAAATLEAQASTEAATIRRLEHELELRKIRAPIDGRIGQAVELRVGSVVTAAKELGAIVPSGKPRVVAFFPVSAIGRIRPGQSARLRLEGFVWTRYGMPEATVVDVGNEPEEGVIRVEMALRPESAPAIPREHGLTGTAEVEVEHLSPAALVLRAAGRLLTTRPEVSAAGAGEVSAR